MIRMISVRPSAKNGSLVPTTDGTATSSPRMIAPTTTRTGMGARQASGGRASNVEAGTSLRRGRTSSTMNSTMNGRLAGNPDNQLTSITYLVDTLAMMPMTIPRQT